MRCLFMIPTKPAPTFSVPSNFSHQFNDFLSKCLVKTPTLRSTATELLKHEFLVNADLDSNRTNLIKSINDSMCERNALQSKFSNGKIKYILALFIS